MKTMSPRLQSAHDALYRFAARNGALVCEEHGSPDRCTASPYLLIFRTADRILHASLHWEGTPFEFAEVLAPAFRDGRTEYAQEVHTIYGADLARVRHPQAFKTFQHRPDLAPDYTDAAEWRTVINQNYFRKLS